MINHSFLETRKNDLIEIYKKERYMNNDGKEGALMVDFRNKNKIDVYFWVVDNMVNTIREKFLEEFKKNIDKKNIAYVILLDDTTIDVRSYQL